MGRIIKEVRPGVAVLENRLHGALGVRKRQKYTHSQPFPGRNSADCLKETGCNGDYHLEPMKNMKHFVKTGRGYGFIKDCQKS